MYTLDKHLSYFLYQKIRIDITGSLHSRRIQAEPKLLAQVEEVTYAEPVLAPQPKPASPRATLRKHPPYHPHHETLFQFQPDAYRRDNFGTLRSHQVNVSCAPSFFAWLVSCAQVTILEARSALQ